METLSDLSSPPSGSGSVRPRGLSLAARITLLLLTVVAGTSAGLAWFGRQTVLDTFAAKEVDLVLQNRTILEQFIAVKLNFLQASTTDWAAWDDFYNYARGRYPEFPARHLGPATLDRLKLDMLLVIDARGRLGAGEVRSPDPNVGTDLVALLRGAAPYDAGHHARGPSVLPVAGSRETIAGVISTRHGPLLLALRPISRTDGSGEPAGTLVLGRYLQAEQLFSALSVLPAQVIVHGSRRHALSTEMHVLAAALGRIPGGSSLVTREDDMSDFRLFRDLAGNPAFILETRMPRTILATGRATVQALLLGLLVAVTVTLLILSTLIQAIVSAPLRRLTRHLLDLRESGERLPTPGRERRDEIGALARRFQELESARHADQARLEQLAAQLAQAQKLEAVGQLAAGVAHEINTPTQYVGGNIRFLDDAFSTVTILLGEITRLVRAAGDGFVPVSALAQALSAADVDYLQAEVPVAIRQSLEGVERVGEIVRSMRELTHPARDLIGTHLNRVIESAVRVAGSEWQGIAEVCLELDPDLPPVPCLAGSINQVIVNILVNAAHAVEAVSAERPRGSGRIVVATSVDDGAAVIRITDNGSGMSEKVRAQVFNPFFTTKEVGQGTGQGLAIAHSVITRHKGSIKVESTPGQGTCFTIRLPLAPQAEGKEGDSPGDSAAAA